MVGKLSGAGKRVEAYIDSVAKPKPDNSQHIGGGSVVLAVVYAGHTTPTPAKGLCRGVDAGRREVSPIGAVASPGSVSAESDLGVDTLSLSKPEVTAFVAIAVRG